MKSWLWIAERQDQQQRKAEHKHDNRPQLFITHGWGHPSLLSEFNTLSQRQVERAETLTLLAPLLRAHVLPSFGDFPA